MYQPYQSAGHTPEPVRPDPPQSVLTAVKLMYAGAVVQAISAILTLASIHAFARTFGTRVNTRLIHGYEEGTVFFGLVFVGLWIWMALANKRGYSWARIVASVLFGIYSLVLLLVLVHAGLALGGLVSILIWLIGLGTIILLWRAESTAFFQAQR